MLTIGLVSPGAMGSAIGRRLVDAGAHVLTSLDGRSAASVERARAAGMIDAPPEALARADLLLSIVPPHSAEEVLQRFLPLLDAAERPALFIDCNALSPEAKRRLAAQAEGRAAGFVDACIIGLPEQAGGPMIYASGPDAAALAILGDHGLRYRCVPGDIGAAAALKMSYAGMNKGMLALGAMMMLAAERAGVADPLREELEASFPAMRERLGSTPMLFAKAWRWVAEMREIAAFAEAEHGADQVFEGFARFCERIADGDEADRGALIT